jgi:hypothetical protein
MFIRRKVREKLAKIMKEINLARLVAGQIQTSGELGKPALFGTSNRPWHDSLGGKGL